MWLYAVSIAILFAILVLRALTAHTVWSRGSATALALASPTLGVAAIAALLLAPSGLQHQSVQLADFAGRVAPVTETVTSTTFWATAGLGGLAAAILPLVIALVPLTRGLRPWPRTTFAISASLLMFFSFVAGFSIGLFFLPAATAAWGPVLIAPRAA